MTDLRFRLEQLRSAGEKTGVAASTIEALADDLVTDGQLAIELVAFSEELLAEVERCRRVIEGLQEHIEAAS